MDADVAAVLATEDLRFSGRGSGSGADLDRRLPLDEESVVRQGLDLLRVVAAHEDADRQGFGASTRKGMFIFSEYTRVTRYFCMVFSFLREDTSGLERFSCLPCFWSFSGMQSGCFLHVISVLLQVLYGSYSEMGRKYRYV